MLITICGVDGAGKSAYQESLSSFLQTKNIKNTLIDPMKKGKFIDELKNSSKNIYKSYSPTIISSFYALDMINNMQNILTNKNEVFLSHRYDICCKVYAEISNADLSMINILLRTIPQTDLMIFLDVTPEIAMQRIEKRKDKRTWKEQLNIIEKAVSLYKKYFEIIPIEKKILFNNNGIMENFINLHNLVYRKIQNFHSCNESQNV